MIAGLLALTSAAVFFGAAIYVLARRDHAGNDLAPQHGFGRVGMVADRKHRVWARRDSGAAAMAVDPPGHQANERQVIGNSARSRWS